MLFLLNMPEGKTKKYKKKPEKIKSLLTYQKIIFKTWEHLRE